MVLVLLTLSCARTRDTSTLQVETTNEVVPDTSAVPLNGLYTFENYLTNEVYDTSLFEVIDYSCAVIVEPTADQILEMRREYGEDDFYIVADDNMWYQANAIGLLDSLKIVRLTVRKPCITFYGHEGQWTMNVRKRGALPWNLIFFNIDKKPIIVSTVDLTAAEITTYFN